ncbi:MAG TPA: RHS repeat-associated core domain-containing protein [Lacunisphaera sp.]|jgi:RHS repeat-associated protein
MRCPATHRWPLLFIGLLALVAFFYFSAVREKRSLGYASTWRAVNEFTTNQSSTQAESGAAPLGDLIIIGLSLGLVLRRPGKSTPMKYDRRPATNCTSSSSLRRIKRLAGKRRHHSRAFPVTTTVHRFIAPNSTDSAFIGNSGVATLTGVTRNWSYDGNGNVIGLVDMATGTKSATYDYNAFGETIQSEGVAALANPFRFSTKYTDDETGLLYYGFRYYQPTTGRFLGRDPSEEDGGTNLYAFVENDGINAVDYLGLWVTAAHNAIADAWLGENYTVKCCCGDIKVTEIIKNSSARVDGFVGIKGLRWLPNLNPFSKNALWKAQAARNDYKHHLTDRDDDFAAMEQQWNAFIDGKLADAKRLAGGSDASQRCQNIKSALAAIGEAFHADSDAYSPMHSGGQEWDGLGHELILHPGRTHAHAAGESLDVWLGNTKPQFTAQNRQDTISAIDSRLRSTLDEVLSSCKK